MTDRKAEVAKLATSVAELMREKEGLFPILDIVAGAMLCLLEAADNFRDRPGAWKPNYRENVQQYTADMSRGKKPDKKLWLAGWHFNSALVRIAAAYHRSLKAATGRKDGNRKELLKLLPWFTAYENLGKVYDEVNSVKHDVSAGVEGREVTFEVALAATRELVEFLRNDRVATVTAPRSQ